jgi:RimJ/RimL family protein N-acetyltransferase
MITFYKNLLQKNNSFNPETINHLSTKRLNLDFFEESDINDIYKNITHEIIMNIGGGMQWPMGKNDIKEWLKRSIEARNNGHFYAYIIREKDTNQFVGMITSFVKQYSTCLYPGKIAYWASESKRGKGYISEALEKVSELYKKYFNLNKIWTTIKADNINSIKVATRFEMKKTGSKWESYNYNEYYWEHVFEKNL